MSLPVRQEYAYASSFYHFIRQHSPLGEWLLPPEAPEDDSLNEDDRQRILTLIEERDYYELNRMIRKRYKWV